jgi:hypothetical protein
MELVQILKSLWSKRWWVALGAVVAAGAAITVLYRVSLDPPGLQDRSVRVGAASAEILIDAPKSTLGDLGRDIVPLTSRGGIFTRYLGTDGATTEIASESGIPASRIAVASPKLSIDGVPDTKSAERAAKLGSSRDYLLQVQQGDELPVLSIFTQGPTADGARRLANATAGALAAVVTSIQDETGVPERRRLTIRQLGTARAGELREEPSRMLAAAVFMGVLGAFCLAILAWPALLAAWRAPDPVGQLIPHQTNGSSPNGHASQADRAADGVEAILSAALAAADRIREDARRHAEAGLESGRDADGESVPAADRRLGR